MQKAIPFEYGDASTPQPNAQMISELQTILTKYQALNRFGLMAIQEDELQPGEIMNETTDTFARTQIVKPAAIKGLGPKTVKTGWRLNKTGALQACSNVCEPSSQGHDTQHKKTQEVQ
ncbi:hypothetical protein BKI52_02515 [marine bacterium AO1-C]|nr:hypothetical protein BKI52_02515 [marine bacterium AO1-C]